MQKHESLTNYYIICRNVFYNIFLAKKPKQTIKKTKKNPLKFDR